MVYHCTNFTTVLSVLSFHGWQCFLGGRCQNLFGSWWVCFIFTDGDIFTYGDAKTYLEVGECALFSLMATFSLMVTPKPIWKLVSVLYFHGWRCFHGGWQKDLPRVALTIVPVPVVSSSRWHGLPVFPNKYSQINSTWNHPHHPIDSNQIQSSPQFSFITESVSYTHLTLPTILRV